MHTSLTLVLLAAAPLPVPPAADLARAEADVREVFMQELEAADTSKERMELAGKRIDREAGSRPAG